MNRGRGSPSRGSGPRGLLLLIRVQSVRCALVGAGAGEGEEGGREARGRWEDEGEATGAAERETGGEGGEEECVRGGGDIIEGNGGGEVGVWEMEEDDEREGVELTLNRKEGACPSPSTDACCRFIAPKNDSDSSKGGKRLQQPQPTTVERGQQVTSSPPVVLQCVTSDDRCCTWTVWPAPLNSGQLRRPPPRPFPTFPLFPLSSLLQCRYELHATPTQPSRLDERRASASREESHKWLQQAKPRGEENAIYARPPHPALPCPPFLPALPCSTFLLPPSNLTEHIQSSPLTTPPPPPPPPFPQGSSSPTPPPPPRPYSPPSSFSPSPPSH